MAPTGHDPRRAARSPWYRGARGEWYVVAQGVIFVVIAIGPATAPGLPAWGGPAAVLGTWGGLALMVAGAALAVAGVMRLGANLTPLPVPRDCSELVTGGAYAIVRNPIYSGLVVGAFGWALWRHGWLTPLYAAALFAFFDVKTRLEERLLAEKFGEPYLAYRARVKKLIPWVY